MPYSAASPYAPPAGLTGGWIDISTPLDPETTPVYPDNFGLVFSFTSELANGQGVNLSKYCVGAHSGTHVDAPLHFLEGGFAIDRLDVGRLIGKAHVLEIPSNVQAITAAVLEKQQWRGHERLLFKTRNSAQDWLMNPGFQQEYCYLAPDAAELLATEPLAMVGIDYLSVEGFQHEPRTHRALLGNSIAVVEGLRLSAIAAGDYEIVVLPLKIVGHEGAPARALLRKLS
jgi:arylformamidase